MFRGMGKHFWGLWVCFLWIGKSQVKNCARFLCFIQLLSARRKSFVRFQDVPDAKISEVITVLFHHRSMKHYKRYFHSSPKYGTGKCAVVL